MIRKFEMDDLDAIMKIWLEANIEAHNFINKSYWHENYAVVRELLPDAAIAVYEDNNVIQGFTGLMENYIAGIFVNVDSRSKGIGKALLDCIKADNSELLLHVYKKNIQAVRFYQRECFTVTEEKVDENTGEEELVMKWSRT
jgi:putative acetyltransferase